MILPKSSGLPSSTFHIGLGEFAKDAVGEGAQRVAAGTHAREFERAIVGPFDPEFIMLGILLPIDGASERRRDPPRGTLARSNQRECLTFWLWA